MSLFFAKIFRCTFNKKIPRKIMDILQVIPDSDGYELFE